jgi:GT2 family glycosyltransferase
MSAAVVNGCAVSVVVPSHGRRLRLRWLLNALQEQTLPADRWEVVVVHDYDDRDTHETFERHPLTETGQLRHIRIEPGTGGAARQRNLGWRAARAPLIAFTDDDCRPDPGWLQQLLATAERHPGAIVQGKTLADPLENDVYASPHHRTVQEFDPPGEFAQTCNILYPRTVLERIGGFDEQMRAPAGEDLDINLRARAAGADYVGAPDALVYHCIEGYTLIGALRLARKWEAIAYLVKLHPEVRRSFPLRIFWRATHLRLMLAALGLGMARRHPVLAMLTLPYINYALRQRGTHLSARVVSCVELPGRVAVDALELAVLIRGSIRHRTLVL